jgi:cell division protein FtsB
MKWRIAWRSFLALLLLAMGILAGGGEGLLAQPTRSDESTKTALPNPMREILERTRQKLWDSQQKIEKMRLDSLDQAEENRKLKEENSRLRRENEQLRKHQERLEKRQSAWLDQSEELAAKIGMLHRLLDQTDQYLLRHEAQGKNPADLNHHILFILNETQEWNAAIQTAIQDESGLDFSQKLSRTSLRHTGNQQRKIPNLLIDSEQLLIEFKHLLESE